MIRQLKLINLTTELFSLFYIDLAHLISHNFIGILHLKITIYSIHSNKMNRYYYTQAYQDKTFTNFKKLTWEFHFHTAQN